MKLTKRKKLQILKKMLELVSGPDFNVQTDGLCWAFHQSDRQAFDEAAQNQKLGCDLTVLGLPKKRALYSSTDCVGFYWPTNEKGLESRKRAIRSAIKRLES